MASMRVQAGSCGIDGLNYFQVTLIRRNNMIYEEQEHAEFIWEWI